jgi:hypothetical protein
MIVMAMWTALIQTAHPARNVKQTNNVMIKTYAMEKSSALKAPVNLEAGLIVMIKTSALKILVILEQVV